MFVPETLWKKGAPMTSRFFLSATTAALVVSVMLIPPAMAASSSDLCPNGNITIIRINKITPKGTAEGFEKAVADHAKWFADHGYGEDRIVSAPVLIYDQANKTMVEATNEVMTIHSNSHAIPRDKHDAAWDAFTAEYRANSEAGGETTACLPR
jgi:hypothetical protein